MVQSRWNYYLSFIFDIFITLFILIYGLLIYSGFWLFAVIICATGFFFFSIIEYFTHRFIFHSPKSPAYRGHVQHHKDPRKLLALPFFVGGAFAIILWIVLSLIFEPIISSFFVTNCNKPVITTTYSVCTVLVQRAVAFPCTIDPPSMGDWQNCRNRPGSCKAVCTAVHSPVRSGANAHRQTGLYAHDAPCACPEPVSWPVT